MLKILRSIILVGHVIKCCKDLIIYQLSSYTGNLFSIAVYLFIEQLLSNDTSKIRLYVRKPRSLRLILDIRDSNYKIQDSKFDI